MIYMQVILNINGILMFEDGFVLESCDLLIILLKKIFYINCWNLCMYKCIFISSPEPKAQGELIVYQSSRRLAVCLAVCLAACLCVNIFKLEYLRNQ